MNICHVITRLIIGGAQENTLLTCKGLARRGHRVTLLAGPETGPEGSLWDDARAAGCDLISVESLRRAVNPFQDLRARTALIQLFAGIKPEVVHTHSSKAGIIGRSAAAAASVPFIVHTIHGMSFNRTQPAVRRALYRFLERRAARYTAAFVTVADCMIEQAVAARLAPRDRFVTIRSGMETEHYQPDGVTRARCRQAWGVADDAVVVGTVARLFDNKGYEQIMAAMPTALAGNDQLRFVWIGDGPRRVDYQRRLAAMGVEDRVMMPGLLPPREVANMITGFDMLLHASQWEGLPRAIVQALLTEVPAVSFDNDGAPEVVIDGETGMLVSLNDTDALAQAIIRLGGDADLRSQMGRRGRARCLKMFDWQVMVDRIESLYQRLVRVSGS